jgi:hypothetical protein
MMFPDDPTSNPKHVREPANEDDFEDMCADIYGEVYCDPGARRNGRRGGKQYGRDIFVTDWSRRNNGHVGRVWVQCKHTEKEKVEVAKVIKDIVQAADLARSDPAYDGVYLFIVATAATDNARLHTEVESLKGRQDLPFEVEFHAWEKLCKFVTKHKWLWERYSDSPGKTLSLESKASAELLAKHVQRMMSNGHLNQAEEEVGRWKAQQPPAYGRFIYPPVDAWKSHPGLRSTLLELYTSARDSWNKVELLEYESRLHESKEARALLDYLVAERIVAHLRAPTAGWPRQGDRPRFGAVLDAYADTILVLEGPPDELGCLALLLILDADDPGLRDRALDMMYKVVERTRGTEWEIAARVAHAIVRYYYVMRAGWTDLARRYALGDRIGHSDWIGLRDPRLDQPFNHAGHDILRTAGGNPLRRPQSGAIYTAVRRIAHWCGRGWTDILPRLSAQCKLYSVFRHNAATSTLWASNIRSLSRSRVVDSETLFGLAETGQHADILTDYGLLATEDTFERLLAYRSVLRAYVESTGGKDQEYERLLDATDMLVSRCELGTSVKGGGKGQICILPVYDEPPPRLIDSDMPALGIVRPSKFTLTREAMSMTIQTLKSWGRSSERYKRVEQRYLDRDEEFPLTCLLALHMSTPMLTYKHDCHTVTKRMGIGTEHPRTFLPRRLGSTF